MPAETVYDSGPGEDIFKSYWFYNESFLHDPRFSIYYRAPTIEAKIGPKVIRHVNTPKAHCCLWQPLDKTQVNGGIPDVNSRPASIGCIESAEELYAYWSTAPEEALKRCRRDGGDLVQNQNKIGIDAELNANPDMPALGHNDRVQITNEFQSLYVTLPIPDTDQFFNGYKGLQYTPECFSPRRASFTTLMVPIAIPESEDFSGQSPNGDVAQVFVLFVGTDVLLGPNCVFTTKSGANANTQLVVRYRTVYNALPPRLRGLQDPSNPCLLEPAKYAVFARTSSTGNNHVDGLTITYANFLQLYGLNGIFASVHRAGGEFKDETQGWNRLFYTGDVRGDRTSFNPFVQENLEANYTNYVSFGTSPEGGANGPFHNPELAHDALLQILKTPLHKDHASNFTDMLTYLKTNMPFLARYNNEFITISFEMVKRPIVALGCRIETVLLNPQDASVGRSSGDIAEDAMESTLAKRHCFPVGHTWYDLYKDNPLPFNSKTIPPPADYRLDNPNLLILREMHCVSAVLVSIVQGTGINVGPLTDVDAGITQELTIYKPDGTLKTHQPFGCLNFNGQGTYRYRNGGIVLSAKNFRNKDDTEWLRGLNIDAGVGDTDELDYYDAQVFLAALWNSLPTNERYDPDNSNANLGNINPADFPDRSHYVWRRQFAVPLCHNQNYPCFHVLPDESPKNQPSKIEPPGMYYYPDASVTGESVKIETGASLYTELRNNFIEYRENLTTNQAHPFNSLGSDEIDKDYCRPTWAVHRSVQNVWSDAISRNANEFDYTVDSIAVQTVVRSHLSVPIASHRSRGQPNLKLDGSIKRRLPIVMGLPSPWSDQQLVPADYTLRPFTASQSESGAAGKALCRCGGSAPEYACLIEGPEFWKRKIADGFKPLGETGPQLESVNFRTCGWSWGGLGAPGIAGGVGLYVGSDFTDVQVIERDILQSNNADVFTNTFAKKFAPDSAHLLKAMGYDNHFKDPTTAKTYKLPLGCARAPYGRAHRQGMSTAARDNMFTQGGSISNLGDETWYAYCEKVNNQRFVQCAEDPYSYEERVAWCNTHHDHSMLTMGFSPGILRNPCMRSDAIAVCLLFAQDLRFPTVESVVSGIPEEIPTHVVVMPMSSQIRTSLQTDPRVFSIAQPYDAERRSTAMYFNDPLKFDPAPSSTIVSVDPSTFALISEPQTWFDHYNPVDPLQDVMDKINQLITTILGMGYNTTTQRRNTDRSDSYENPTCEDGLVFLPIHDPDVIATEVGACVEPWHLQPTLTTRNSLINRPNIHIHAGFGDRIYVPPITDVDVFGSIKRGSCNALAITSPNVSIEAHLYVDQTGCEGVTGNGVVGVTASGDTVDGLYIKGVTVAGSRRAAAVAFLGGDREFNAQAKTLSMSGVSIDYVKSSQDEHEILLAHTTAAPKSVDFPDQSTLFIQESSAVDNFEVDCSNANCVWVDESKTYIITNVTELTSIFGAPFERRYYHPTVNHNQALIVAISVLLPVAVALVVALGAIYYRGARKIDC
ncbi:MAG: hypothetical protein ACPGR8_12920 [Limisphaerales bacterium]